MNVNINRNLDEKAEIEEVKEVKDMENIEEVKDANNVEESTDNTKNKENSLLYIHEFKEAIEYEGQTYKGLVFNFAKLKGSDALAVEKELSAIGKAAVVPEYSVDYRLRMALRACEEEIGLDFFDIIPLRDFNRISGAARRFLLGI